MALGAFEQLIPLLGKPGLALHRQGPACGLHLTTALHQQIKHLLRPAVPDSLVGLLVDKAQLAQVVGVAQAVRALQALVGGQPIVHQRATHTAENAQRLKGLTGALGMRAQPGQAAGDCAMQPGEFALHPDARLVSMHHGGALHGLANGRHRGLQSLGGLLAKRQRAGL